MKLSVVIVNYNVKYYLEQCLRSLEAAVTDIDCEIIVVDNDSHDASMEYLKPRFPGVIWIESKVNGGFSHGNNIGFAKAQGEYVLMLNPDTIVTKETIEGCISFMDNHSDAGACGVYMLRTDGSFAPESRRALPTPFVAFCKMSGLSKMFPKSRTFGRYYMQYLDKEEENPIEIISGAYMMMRHTTLKEAGYLDEQFFMYGEDIDLSYRILKKGYKNYFLPLRILHYKGESTNKSSYKYVHTFYSAMQIFFKKHYSHYSLLVSLPISLAIWSRALLAYIGNQFVHNTVQEQPLLNCLVIGSADTIAHTSEILRKKQNNGRHTFIEASEATMPLGHLSDNIDIKGYDTVLYDTDVYTYSTILRLLDKTEEPRLRLATYSTSTKKLIFEDRVYDYEEIAKENE